MSILNISASAPPCIGGKPCAKGDCAHYSDCRLMCKTPDWDAMESIVDDDMIDELEAILDETDDDDDIGEIPDYAAMDAMSFDFTPMFGIPMLPTEPRDYSFALLDKKMALLSSFAGASGLTILAETVRYNSSIYPPVSLRVTVGGIKTFKRGVTLCVSSREKDERIFVDGVPIHSHGYDRETFVIRDHSFAFVDCTGDARRYAVDERLEGAFICSEFYPYNLMPMADAVTLCRAFKYGTVIPSKDYKRMLRMAKEIVWGGRIGG